jgi:hypothetical protein
MKNSILRISLIIIISLLFISGLNAQMKKVAQSGMTYLAISLGARESAMGNASVASVRGVQGLFYNPAVLAAIEGFAVTANQVNWLADTKLYGLGAAARLGRYGTVGFDVVYMDYGQIVGTRRVDRSVDERGFVITGDINVEEYALGVAYAYPVNDKFSFGAKIKFVHEDLGDVPIAVGVIDQEAQLYEYEDRDWSLNHWGFDVGAHYLIGYKDLAFAIALQNYSGDMTYWTEAFQMPLVIRMGLVMDVSELFMPQNENFNINTTIDAVNPNDYTGRIHIGSEIEYLKIFSLRGGYQFNHDVESFSLGFGVKFDYQGYVGVLDYAYTSAEFFKDINRFSLSFYF